MEAQAQAQRNAKVKIRKEVTKKETTVMMTMKNTIQIRSRKPNRPKTIATTTLWKWERT
jgi:hypothetical protein